MRHKSTVSVPKLPPLPRGPATVKTQAYRDRFGGFADNALNAFMEAQDRTARALDAVDALRMNRNPAHTVAAHLQQIERESTRTLEQLRRNLSSVGDSIKARQEQVQAAIDARVRESKTDDAAEIRAVLRELPKAKRQAAIREAIEAGDTALLGAVASASSPSLIGLEPDEYAKATRAIRHYLSPAEHDLADALADAAQLSRRAQVEAADALTQAAGNPAVQSAYAKQTADYEQAMNDLSAVQ